LMATSTSEEAQATGSVPTIDHAGMLEDLDETPAYLMPRHEGGHPQNGKVSCSFCGVGDGGTVERVPEVPESSQANGDEAPSTVRNITIFKEVIKNTAPSTGCVKLR